MNAASRIALFISDLHLTATRPDASERFFRFLQETAPGSADLYILGDFFDAWVGDDDLANPLHAEVAAGLRGLTEGGTAVHLMHGNRDFLLGETFYRTSRAHPLPDPSVIVLHGRRTLLLHGDTLCTEDTDYLAFRRTVRDPAWQTAFLARPLAERHALARDLRARSEQVKGEKRPEIMDVHPPAVEAAFRMHGVDRIIHGHTHRPARHDHQVEGRGCERWVLPDWYDTGGALACDDTGCRLRGL